ncbi:family 16 glycoside hydrolase [Sphingobacterium alkalisoli]|uniref:family 16 glycoside hydrolase n=1 Tax=Sphingobacterium alkalisoli TaxID=1874115 RepID=UPI0016643224|nr:family 16 glycoside hydrolase [Sphingobacterium alkalisoli]
MIRIILFLFLFATESAYSQKINLDVSKLVPVNVYMEVDDLQGESIVRVVKDSTVKEADEPTFVRIKNANFKNGIIEVEVLSRLLSTASPTDRGFIGLAFRINDMNSNFESIYLRPTNGRAEDQVRRNHSIQYFSFPDYKYDRLRKENPEKYESYADMGLNEWIRMKIEIEGDQARLFLNEDKQPSLIVKDLKQGADTSGAVGLFVDVGTEGYFRNLRISPSN